MESISPIERWGLHLDNGDEWYASTKDIDEVILDIQSEKNKGNYKQAFLFTLDLGQMYELADDIDKAEVTYKEAIIFAKHFLPMFSPLVAFALLGQHYYSRGMYDEALPLFEKVVGILESKYSERSFVEESVSKSPYIGEYKNYMGRVFLRKRDFEKALELFNEAMELAHSPIGSMLGIAECYYYQHDYIRSRRKFMELYEYYHENIVGKGDNTGLSQKIAEDIVTAAYFLGIVLDIGDDENAIGCYEYCYNFYKQKNEKDIPEYIKDSLNTAKQKFASSSSTSRILERVDFNIFELNLTQWSYFLDLAHCFGWHPEGTHPPEDWRVNYGEWEKWDYYTNHGQIISSNDTLNIAKALMNAYNNGWPNAEGTDSNNFEGEETRTFLKSLAIFFTRGSVKVY